MSKRWRPNTKEMDRRCISADAIYYVIGTDVLANDACYMLAAILERDETAELTVSVAKDADGNPVVKEWNAE